MSKAANIQRQMQQVRFAIDDDVDELVEEAKSLVDWRDYVRSRPLAAMGIACALGYAVIPKRSRIVKADADLVAKLIKQDEVVLAPNAKVKQNKPWTGALLTTVVGVVLRSFAGQVGHQMAAKFSDKVDAPE